MALVYTMRAFKTTPTTGYVYWDVLNTPDLTGSSSPFSPSDLADIVVFALTDNGNAGLAAIATSGSGADLVANTVSNAKLATMGAFTFKGNNSASTATPTDVAAADLVAALSLKVGGFGDGSDGPAVFDGVGAVTGYTGPVANVYTATRQTAFTGATFAGGVVLDQTQGGVLAGYRIFFSGTVTVTSGTATIKYNGNPASGQTGGTGLGNNPQGNNSAAGSSGLQNAGQNGGNVDNWTDKTKGGSGGGGGSSPTAIASAGGTTNNTFTTAQGEIDTWFQAMKCKIDLVTPGIVSGGAGGGSGAGTVGIASGGGGGGGAGVGCVGIAFMSGTGTLAIEARGGAGGGGGSGVGSNAAGGGGGGGGILFVGYGGATQPSTLTISAPGGAGGAAQGIGNPGSTGGTGTTRFYPLGAS